MSFPDSLVRSPTCCVELAARESAAGRAAPVLPTTDAEWPTPVGRYLRGEITDAELESAAIQERMPLDDRRLAAAYFYIGVRHLALGDRDAARSAFTFALAQNAPRHAELVAAAALLERMGR
jgi:lipoprotein NlpI